jgi:outer membrane biosynthesis protein TonB
MNTQIHRLVLLSAIALSGKGLWDNASAQTRKNGPAKYGFCQLDAPKITGQKPVQITGKIRAPKKIHHVSPKYPAFPPETTARGVWIGEALIDTAGKIARVWTIREVEITPPFPAFNAAIVNAIRQWEFEPLVVDGVRLPVCMTVTVNIDWE